MSKEGRASYRASKARAAATPRSRGGTGAETSGGSGGSSGASKPVYFYNPKTGHYTYRVGGGSPGGGWQRLGTTQPSGYVGGQTRGVATDVDKAQKQQEEVAALKSATAKKEKQIMALELGIQQGLFSQKAAEKAKAAQQEFIQDMPATDSKKVAFDIGGQTFIGTYGLSRTSPKQAEAVSLPLAQFRTAGKEELNILAPERKPGPQESKAPSYAGQPIYGIRPVSMDVAENISDNKLLAPVAVPGPQESAVPEGTFRGSYDFDITKIKPFDMEKHKVLDLTMDMSKVAKYRDTKVSWENVKDIEKALKESNLLTQKALLRDQTLSKKQASDIRIGEEVSTKVKDFLGVQSAKPIITLAATTLGVGAAGQVLGSLSKVAVAGKLIKIGSPVLKGAWGASLALRGSQQVGFIREGQAERGLLGFAGLGAEVGGVALAGKWLAATQGKPITKLYKQAYTKVRGPFFERDILKWQKGITDKHWIYDKAYSDISGQKTLHGKPISQTAIKGLRQDVNKGFYNIDPVRTELVSTGFAKTKGFSNVDFLTTQQHLTSTYILGKSGKVVKIIPHTDPTRAINVKAIDWRQGKEIVITPKKMTSFKYSQILDVEPTRFTFINKPLIKEPLYKVIEMTHIPGHPDVSVQAQLIKKTTTPFVYKHIPEIKIKTPKEQWRHLYLKKQAKAHKKIKTPSKEITAEQKLILSYKTDRTALDRVAKHDAAEISIKEAIKTQESIFGKQISTPYVETIFIQNKPVTTISNFKGVFVPLWSPNTKQKLDISPIQVQKQEQMLDTKQILDIKQVTITKQMLDTKQVTKLDISQIQVQKQEQILDTEQILMTEQILDTKQIQRTKQIPITKQILVTEQIPITKQILDTKQIAKTEVIIEEPPPRIIVPGLPSLSLSKKRAMPGIDLGFLSFKQRRREIDIAPLSDLLSINITEMFTGGRRATHPRITEEEKLLFDTGIKRGRQHFPTMEMRAGKVKLPRSYSIFGTTKRKHKKSRKRGDWVFDLL